MRSSPAAALALVALGVGALPGRALAQAWLPSGGEGTLTITYQDTLAPGELDRYGQLRNEVKEDTVRAHTLIPEIEWGLTDRVALNLTLPFITARYKGDHPHLINVRGLPNSIDDGTYHGGFQDFRFGVRYGLRSGTLAIAPFAEGIVPSHHYESRAHSAIGTDMRAVRMGVNVGIFLDRVAPGLYVHTQLSHAVVQEVVEIRPNRSSLDSEVGYFVTPRLTVRFLEALVLTHDGLQFREARTDISPFSLQHDRINRRNFLNLGGGVSVAFTDSLGGFAAVMGTVWGETVHPIRGVSTGMTWYFRPGGGQVAPSRNSRRSAEPTARP